MIHDPLNLTYQDKRIAVVDIDPDTAQVTVRRFIAVDDAACDQPDGRRRPDPRRAHGGTASP